MAATAAFLLVAATSVRLIQAVYWATLDVPFVYSPPFSLEADVGQIDNVGVLWRVVGAAVFSLGGGVAAGVLAARWAYRRVSGSEGDMRRALAWALAAVVFVFATPISVMLIQTLNKLSFDLMGISMTFAFDPEAPGPVNLFNLAGLILTTAVWLVGGVTAGVMAARWAYGRVRSNV